MASVVSSLWAAVVFTAITMCDSIRVYSEPHKICDASNFGVFAYSERWALDPGTISLKNLILTCKLTVLELWKRPHTQIQPHTVMHSHFCAEQWHFSVVWMPQSLWQLSHVIKYKLPGKEDKLAPFLWHSSPAPCHTHSYSTCDRSCICLV